MVMMKSWYWMISFIVLLLCLFSISESNSYNNENVLHGVQTTFNRVDSTGSAIEVFAMNALFSLKTFKISGNAVVHEFDLCPNENDQHSKDDYVGKIGVARRGICTFDKKAVIAENLGMIGMIVINHNESVIPMGCSNKFESKIPVVMIANNTNTNALYDALKREAFTVRLVKGKLFYHGI